MTGTANWLAYIGLQPGGFWALLAGLTEFGGGALLVLLGVGATLLLKAPQRDAKYAS